MISGLTQLVMEGQVNKLHTTDAAVWLLLLKMCLVTIV